MSSPYTLLLALAIASQALAQTAVSARFRRFDKNGDGKITADELGMPAVFKAADKNGDGAISPEEFTTYLNTRRGKKGSSTPQASSSAEIAKHADVRYAETPGVEANAQSLDIYAPKNAKNAPVMMYVHGGGWRGGDKRSLAAAPGFFNGQGFIFVSINYRLLPAGKHPNNVADVALAIAWVHDSIARYGGDPSQLFLYGHSAGAHLVALVATDERHLKAAGKSLAVLKAVIPLDTNAYDIPELTAGKGEGNLYVQAFGADAAAQKDASPLAHVAPGKGIPPMLVFHSSSGTGSRNEQGKAFVAALKAAGVDAELIPSMKQSHADINRQFGTPGDMVTEAAMRFVNRVRRKTTGDRASTDAKLSAAASATHVGSERRRRPPADPVQPTAMPVHAVAGQALDLQITWKRSLQLPLTDAAGKTLTGTEVMELVAHDGKLFAGNSHWGDAERNEGGERPPTQVFVKESADAPWRVDLELGSAFTRTSCSRRSSAWTSTTPRRSTTTPYAVLMAARAASSAWR